MSSSARFWNHWSLAGVLVMGVSSGVVEKEAASWWRQSAVLGCSTRALISQAPINSKAAVAVIGGWWGRDRWGG
jgi:hypothetical protein